MIRMMMRSHTELVLATVSFAAIALGLAGASGCGPACLDDRCSLKTATPRVDRLEGPSTPSDGGVAGSTVVTALPPSDAQPAQSSGAQPAQGSGAQGSGAQGSAAQGSAAQGAGSAAPTAPTAPTARLEWSVFDNLADNTRVLVVTKDAVPAGTLVKFDFAKLPDKTPFAVFLETRPTTGGSQAEASWNVCPPDKLRCDIVGTKSAVTKHAGRLSLQAKTNWVITGFTGDPTAYLVTWTNSLTREALTIRLTR